MNKLNFKFVEKFKIESIKFLLENKFFESKLLTDILCCRESCLFNKVVLFDKNLIDRLYELDKNLHLELVVNLKLNKIKINTGE